ncbi:MAG: hypothetical protein AB2598_16770 [Candidatus Thiodiazotropha sp.]
MKKKVGAKKGENRFRQYQTEKVDKNMVLVQEALEKVSSIKNKFNNEKELVAYLVDATELHRTTLTRKGSKYKPVILEYLNKVPGAIRKLPVSQMSEEALRAYAIVLELELQEKEEELRKVKSQHKPLAITMDVTDVALLDLAMTIVLIQETFPDFIEINTLSQKIINLTLDEGDPGRVIAFGQRTRSLFQIMKDNPAVFGSLDF